MNIILKEDLDLLFSKISEIEDQIFQLGEEFKEAVNQSSETWHDNAPFDVVRDKQALLAQERAYLYEISTRCTVHTPIKSQQIAVGSVVHLRGSIQKVVFIAGEWCGRATVRGAHPVTIRTPLAHALIGKVAGESISLSSSRITILAVE